MARQCVVAVGLALLMGSATIPAAYADGEETPVVVDIPTALPSGDLTPGGDVTEPGGVTDPGEVTAPGGDVAQPGGVTDPGGEATDSGGDPGTGESGGTGTDTGSAPAELPRRLQQRIPEGLTADSQVAVPASDEATATPVPSITPEASETAVPIALPEPVTKTIDAVVATATGSPLYVQLLTVLVLIGAGMAYFRVLGSKGTRVPSKSVK